jgi:hypothetical protein
LAQQDTENPIIHFDENGNYTDTISYNQLYTPFQFPDGTYSTDPLLGGKGQYFMDYNMRLALGLDPAGTDWIGYRLVSTHPFFKLTWFSADELLNNGNYFVDYYGFDHTGKATFFQTDFRRFLYGERIRMVGLRVRLPHSSRFTSLVTSRTNSLSRILIFRVGVRVDRFDANQKVLKDPYSSV